jgi:hypothetical protein
MGSAVGSAGHYGRVLGVSCTSNAAYFAVVVEGAFSDLEPRRIEPPEVLAGGDKLVDFRDRMRREISRIGPELVVIATSSYQADYGQIAARATLEALTRLAAAEEHVPSEFIHQRTIRAKLGLSRTGGFAVAAQRHLRDQVDPIPLYWSEGRAAAAAAALARCHS